MGIYSFFLNLPLLLADTIKNTYILIADCQKIFLPSFSQRGEPQGIKGIAAGKVPVRKRDTYTE
jgi:hypothetical protein